MIELTISQSHPKKLLVITAVMLALLGLAKWSAQAVFAADAVKSFGEKIITIHDGDLEKGIVTDAPTLRSVLEQANITIEPNDITEPSLDEPLVGTSYEANIYRARPVVVEDGLLRTRIVTAYRTPAQVADQAGLPLKDGDAADFRISTDIIADGAAEILQIDRATPLTFMVYGKTLQTATRAKTVGAMLAEKQITPSADDTLRPGADAPIVAGMTVELWRNGKQTLTVEEDVPFTVRQIKDANHPVGFKELHTEGELGRRTVTYEIVMRDGAETDRQQISSVATKEPVEQVEIIGAKAVAGQGLTKAKGVMMFTDSKGVTHRETYYDLPMNIVMRNCGMGGYYTVREDGVKVDRDGYVIVAAHLGNYPRCSVVETSLGAGKVYDTGGFATVHPYGFDLATDWTKADGI